MNSLLKISKKKLVYATKNCCLYRKNQLTFSFKKSFDLNNYYKLNKNFSQKINYLKESNIKGYINYTRKHSYKHSFIDPLNIINTPSSSLGIKEEFNAASWGLGQVEKLEEFPIDSSGTFTDTLMNKNTTVMELEDYLKKLYLSSVGVEFEHLDSE